MKTDIVKKISMFAASLAAVAVMVPSLAFAHGSNGGDKSDDHNDGRKIELRNNLSSVNEFGVRVFDDNNDNKDNDDSDRGVKRGHDMQFMPGLFYSGEVTAVSGSGFTMTSNAGVSLTVNTGSAKLIQIPRSVIVLADIQVGDKVFVTGTKSGSTVTASVVYDKASNIHPAAAKGTVTAVSGTTLTVQGKNGSEATVTTDSDTQITKDGEAATFADIAVGTKVKIFGLWDSILNIFAALKVAIK
jgi:hypothetical protein